MSRYECPWCQIGYHPAKPGAKLHDPQALIHDQVEREQAVKQRGLGDVPAGAGLARYLGLLA